MKNLQRSRAARPLASRIAAEATAAQVAEALIATWHDIDGALATIIGRGGVVAVYERSLQLSAASHPWLASMPRSAGTTVDPTWLRAVLVQQGSAKAVAGGRALLQNFEEVLSGLLGPSLTERLLRPACNDAVDAVRDSPRPRTRAPN